MNEKHASIHVYIYLCPTAGLWLANYAHLNILLMWISTWIKDIIVNRSPICLGGWNKRRRYLWLKEVPWFSYFIFDCAWFSCFYVRNQYISRKYNGFDSLSRFFYFEKNSSMYILMWRTLLKSLHGTLRNIIISISLLFLSADGHNKYISLCCASLILSL